MTSPERLEAEERSVNCVFAVGLLANTSRSIGRPANRQTGVGTGTGRDWLECV